MNYFISFNPAKLIKTTSPSQLYRHVCVFVSWDWGNGKTKIRSPQFSSDPNSWFSKNNKKVFLWMGTMCMSMFIFLSTFRSKCCSGCNCKLIAEIHFIQSATDGNRAEGTSYNFFSDYISVPEWFSWEFLFIFQLGCQVLELAPKIDMLFKKKVQKRKCISIKHVTHLWGDILWRKSGLRLKL